MSVKKQNVPVYYFMGLLESGKTSVIRDFLQNNQFAKAECNLIIMGEEGEEELEDSLLEESHSKVIVVDDVEELTTEFYEQCQEKYHPSSVIIEANGMWSPSDYMDITLPEAWFGFQNVGLVNAETFEVYQKNMKDRFVDLFRYCELIIFNRCDHATRQQDIRRNVRVVNRRVQVIFESDLEDFEEEAPELPFDVHQDTINVELDDYGAWFVDMQDHPEVYDKKRMVFDGYICSAQKNNVIHYGVGRVGMACCAEDMMFLGIAGTGAPFKQLDYRKNERKWGKVTGVIHVKQDKNGEIENIKIKVEDFEEAQKPEDTIVYFN
ncbi:MAG: hypothetical protein K6C05_05910 [Anaerovibrio sp.]|uniref:TIGR03943 family putative permease subunit n=1 Tax=Anaerovibrio sp. TaxID=1872532 RepID=UPI0025DE165B|nr:GTP-binding protein [Anaerovibrio sp.]MCR5176370.1 hypothetical protein [Anaerovibrio sp.]